MPHRKPSRSLNIGIYSSYLQGFFLGEIVNQLRQLAIFKGYNVSVFRTDGHGDFDLKLGLDALDGVIILKNAVTVSFAELMLSKNIPVVSIAYDYFPLDIPHITTDNYRGMELAFDYLVNKGHKDIVFVGDLAQFDLRKRYEAFCELNDKIGVEFDETMLITVENSLLVGGYQAAKEFVARGCNASAVICAAGLLGMGFVKQLSSSGIELSSKLEVVSFDAIASMPVVAANITTVDTNLNVIAYRALSVLTQKIEGVDVEHTTLVPPKLIVAGESENNIEPYMATCVELDTFYNPAYMKSIVANIYEWPREIVASSLDEIMSIAPIFERYMGIGALSRIHMDRKNRKLIAVQRIFKHTATVDLELKPENIALPEKFPPEVLVIQGVRAHDTVVHFPIRFKEEIWGVLSMWGSSLKRANSSFLGFTGYMDLAVKMYSMNLEINAKPSVNAATSMEIGDEKKVVIKKTNAKVFWDVTSGDSEWSNEALELVGLESPMEKNIYKNADIYERIHEDDNQRVRDMVLESLDSLKPASVKARIKVKRSYVQATIQTEPDELQGGKVEKMTFSITLLDLSVG